MLGEGGEESRRPSTFLVGLLGERLPRLPDSGQAQIGERQLEPCREWVAFMPDLPRKEWRRFKPYWIAIPDDAVLLTPLSTYDELAAVRPRDVPTKAAVVAKYEFIERPLVVAQIMIRRL